MTVPDPGRPGDYFDASYRGRAPWDIGAPQPALMALLDEFPPTGPVLDIGCGMGELALALAARGYVTLGVDMASAAIIQAQAKAAAAGPELAARVEFRVADALHPAALGEPFGAVVDSGFYHLCGPAEREGLARELAVALAPGGRYYLLGFGFDSPIPGMPRRVREEELRTLFSPERGWRLPGLRTAELVTRSPPASSVALEGAAHPDGRHP